VVPPLYAANTVGQCIKTVYQIKSCDLFFKFCHNYIFVIGDARHFEFRVLIDTSEYKCMHDILLLTAMCSELRDLFKFWEISDNISETVHVRDIFAMED